MYPVVMAKKSDNSRIRGLKGVAQVVAQTERNEMRYTELRGRVFWFRRRVPEPIQAGMVLNLDGIVAKVGKGINPYIRFSLNTTDRGDARKLALKYAHLLDKAADQLKAASSALPPSAIPLSFLLPTRASGVIGVFRCLVCGGN